MERLDELTDLTDEDVAALSTEDLRELAAWADAEAERLRHERLTVRQFLTSPEHLGQSLHWPAVVDEAECIVNAGATEVALCWGTGAGKSALGGALMCWLLYRILPSVTDGSFFSRYKLGGDKPVFFFCLATRKEQVQQNLYREVRGRVERSPWFQEHFPHDPKARSELWFLRNGERLPICVKPMPAAESAVLSYDCYCAACDEAGFFVASAGVLGDQAENIWQRLHSRMSSRFLGHGLLMNLSAPRYENDFSQRRCREIEESNDPKLYASRRTLWQTKPELVAELEAGQCFELEHPITGESVRIPQSLAAAFATDARRAWNDLAAVPFSATEPFDPSADGALALCRTLTGLPEAQRQYGCRVHIDIGLKHDRCAVAMCYGVGEKVTLARAAIIQPRSDTKTVEIEDIRAQLRHWKAQGWLISGVTADRFQSVDLLQRLKRDGFRTDVLSVDMDAGHYVLLRTLLHQGSFAFYQSDETELFCREYGELMLLKGSKIDHPPKGSKDMADAICGAVSMALSHASADRPLHERVRIFGGGGSAEGAIRRWLRS